MTVIHKELISREITRHDILPLSFLKKSPYTGSKGGMRFRMEKAEEGEEEKKQTVLLCSVWPEPFAYEETDPEKIVRKSFAFSDPGIEDSILWLNEEMEKRRQE